MCSTCPILATFPGLKEKTMHYDLRSLTDTQLVRLHRRAWDRMTAGDGYQPFGYDAHTLWITSPGWMEVIAACKTEATRRLHG